MPTREKQQEALLDRIMATDAPGPADDTSERILNAAVSQAEEFGVRRFTIGDVAQRVGVSRVTVYKYFPGKDRLIEAVLLREMRRFLREVDAAIAPYETLEERLVEGFVFGLGWLRKHRLLNRLLRTEPELIVPNLTVRAGPVLTAGREFIAGFARREAGEGRLPLSDEQIDGVSELLARAVLSFVLTPDSVLRLRTEADTRRFAENYLAPTLAALTPGPR
jgi:AcrR family transcriptional regulator